MERYEVIIVGAGPSGLSAAIEAAKRGIKVIVFDENELIKQGLPADQITLFKQEFNKMLIQKGLINQTKQSFLQSLPLSMISQILYNDGKQFVLSYPQGNFWNERHVLYRVSQ